MSCITCENEKKEIFTLGTFSFDFLDRQDVFDDFDEILDPHSEVILKVTGNEKLNKLADKIITSVNKNLDLRADLRDKLLAWAKYLKTSKEITVIIQ